MASGPEFVSRRGIFILLIFVHKKEPKRLRFLKISSWMISQLLRINFSVMNFCGIIPLSVLISARPFVWL